MKPRLFWTTLAAFVLVIGLGICGMLVFVSLAFAGVWQPGEPRSFPDVRPSYAAFLGDYYVAHNNSWDGIEQRLETLQGAPFGSAFGVGVADASAHIVASSNATLSTGQSIDARTLASGTPIVVRGARVGTLLTRVGIRNSMRDENSPPTFVWPIVRAFLSAGLALMLVLTLLAVLFARWLSAPLRRLRTAAQALASGQMAVQVQGARVRELDELADSFNTMATALHDADRQRRQLTADIAHELRTPLTIIKGRLEGVQDEIYQPTPEQIGGLLSEVALLERLIEDLRLLALAEAGQLPLYPEALDPRDLLDDAAVAFADQTRTQGVTLQVSVPNDLPLIFADPQRLAQVLTNLMSNALRYTPTGGLITLSAKTTDDRRAATDDRNPLTSLVANRSPFVQIEVRDTGAGIAPDDLPHVFDRFWRADRARTRGSGGTGLGLAIAKQIIVAHGGTISAQLNPPHGTTMQITLPVAESEF